MLKSLAAVAVLAISVVHALPAHAASPRCGGLVLRSVEMVSDREEVGVLDAGDVFTITFQRPIGELDAWLGVGLGFVGADGASAGLEHPYAEIEYTQTAKSVTVSVQEFNIVGDPLDGYFGLPLPVTITDFSGVTDRWGNELDRHVSSRCSKDVVLD